MGLRLADTRFQMASRKQKQLAGLVAICVTFFLLLRPWHYARYVQHAPTTMTPGPSAPDPEGRLISRKIWQIWFQQPGAATSYVADPKLRETATWIGMNTGYQYRLVGRDWGNRFVGEHFGANKTLAETYRAITNHGLKSDLLRYMVLHREGGVYSDIDTLALEPIDNWVPEKLRSKARLIVGIEFDKRDGPSWADIPHDLQFCQWTIGAAPGHPVFLSMIDRALTTLKELTTEHKTTIGSFKPTSFETMNSTGPAAWTDVVFSHIKMADPNINELTDLSRMHEPRLFGDILVLPIDGFGMGQDHSGSTNDGSIPWGAYVKHLFHGGWRD